MCSSKCGGLVVMVNVAVTLMYHHRCAVQVQGLETGIKELSVVQLTKVHK